MIQAPKCDLPPLPDPIEPKVVGWPTPEQVVVSKSDMIAIIQYVTGLHDWIRAAAGCLESRKEQTFYGAVNSFMAGK